jgi:prevent-host-death family protein
MKSDRKNRSPHEREWQLQDAKNRLSQVVESARQDGPQTITLRGKPAAVVVSFEEFRKLVQPQLSLSQFFRQSPLQGLELDFRQSEDLSREVEL